MEHPKSPDDVIDPRWTSVLRAETPAGPASVARHDDLAPPRGRHEAEEAAVDLDAELRQAIEPWQQGRRSAADTLVDLRRLAERVQPDLG
jgi:hypothetical protein